MKKQPRIQKPKARRLGHDPYSMSHRPSAGAHQPKNQKRQPSKRRRWLEVE